MHSYHHNLLIRLVRLDSPNLNYLIIVGSFMVYSCCIVFVVPTLNPSTMAAFCVVSSTSLTLYINTWAAAVICAIYNTDSCLFVPCWIHFNLWICHSKTVEDSFDLPVTKTNLQSNYCIKSRVHCRERRVSNKR